MGGGRSLDLFGGRLAENTGKPGDTGDAGRAEGTGRAGATGETGAGDDATPTRGAGAAAGAARDAAPLAARMRPRSLDEVVGQEHLVAPGAPLRALAESGRLPSLVLWGPPGCGKTTLAALLARAAPDRPVAFEARSAVTVGVKEIRELAARAGTARAAGRRTVLFLDEIHRFNRAQQDVLLPHVESGTVTLIGATTENPSFEVNAALLSRCRVFTLRRLEEPELRRLLERALGDRERGLGERGLRIADDAAGALVALADGDARRALGLLEAGAALHGGASGSAIAAEDVERAAGQRVWLHDRDGDAHYDVASALIKSLRASDPDAAVYWLARLLAAGDDPLFAARRLVVFAAEDVGNADPAALGLAVATFAAVERIGLPEGRIPLAQAATYLACAPKSNAAYLAVERATRAALEHGSLPVPLHLRNAPTGLLRSLGHGRDYRYPHDVPDGFVDTPNLPDEIVGARFYEPGRRGAEAALAERLAGWRRRRESATGHGAEARPEPRAGHGAEARPEPRAGHGAEARPEPRAGHEGEARPDPGPGGGQAAPPSASRRGPRDGAEPR